MPLITGGHWLACGTPGLCRCQFQHPLDFRSGACWGSYNEKRRSVRIKTTPNCFSTEATSSCSGPSCFSYICKGANIRACGCFFLARNPPLRISGAHIVNMVPRSECGQVFQLVPRQSLFFVSNEIAHPDCPSYRKEPGVRPNRSKPSGAGGRAWPKDRLRFPQIVWQPLLSPL